MNIWVVWNHFSIEQNKYTYIPKAFTFSDVITRKVLKHWTFKSFMRRARLTKKACLKLCEKI